MTTALRKAIATRSRLENRYYKDKSIESKLAYKIQRIVCSRLYKKERNIYYTKLNITNILTIVSSGRLWLGKVNTTSKEQSL